MQILEKDSYERANTLLGFYPKTSCGSIFMPFIFYHASMTILKLKFEILSRAGVSVPNMLERCWVYQVPVPLCAKWKITYVFNHFGLSRSLTDHKQSCCRYASCIKVMATLRKLHGFHMQSLLTLHHLACRRSLADHNCSCCHHWISHKSHCWRSKVSWISHAVIAVSCHLAEASPALGGSH